jgi:long-chain acyl-CoA synthetase
MYPGMFAATTPDKPAVVAVVSGAEHVVSFGELDAYANRAARLFHAIGLQAGDHVAVVVDNGAPTIEAAWGCIHAGLVFTPVNWRLTADEAAFIVTDCGAKAVLVSAGLQEVAAGLDTVLPDRISRFALGGDLHGYRSFEDAIADYEPTPLPSPRTEGRFMFYSSGTTGRPKGVAFDAPLGVLGESRMAGIGRELYGFSPDTTYLCPAPLYHAAGLGWSLEVQRDGATVVVMDRFDPEAFLGLVERHRVTHTQLVPTMFIRLLRLPADVRRRYDLSSLEVAIHSSAPCPVAVKREMIAWWGPILHEYYSGTEGAGTTHCTSQQWLARPGTVGRPVVGTVHICDEDGIELEPGEIGTVWFEHPAGFTFHYHGDEGKTAASRDPRGWATLRDIGYVDAEGWLFLTDRRDFTIISGGVNIYPREIEDVLLGHPAVLDVAVFGVPDDEFGEQVKAVVQPVDFDREGGSLTDELTAWCRDRLAHFKCPKTFEYRTELPRHPTGKLYKRALRDEYVVSVGGPT